MILGQTSELRTTSYGLQWSSCTSIRMLTLMGCCRRIRNGRQQRQHTSRPTIIAWAKMTISHSHLPVRSLTLPRFSGHCSLSMLAGLSSHS